MEKPSSYKPLPLITKLCLHLLCITFFFTPSNSSSLDSFLYGGCSQIKYTPAASQYESNLNSLLTSLVNSATYSAYNKYKITAPTPQDVVYGLYQCRADLSMPDCATCILRAVTRLGPMCSGSCGGAVQLEGCFVKYDNVSFLGVEDKAVVAKKCGPSDGVLSGDLMGRRDAMLAGLNGAGGAYRVGGSEDVQGVAQCVGDLSNGQCQDCLAEAIRRLKAECGGGVFGDMFLGKCYARYSTTGPQGLQSYSGSNQEYSSSHSHSESEKTFAIILGLLAGVALLIIFLTFVRRFFGTNEIKINKYSGDRPLQISPGNYNFKGLDFVVAEAKRFRINLILSLVNNWSDFGGRKQYVEWANNEGRNLNSEDAFYTDPVVKGFYKNHIKAVLTRVNSISGIAYKDGPTILAWELINEPRCLSHPSGKYIQEWVAEMSAYLKSIDENHLLEIGLEGFYGPTKKPANPGGNLVGTDFISNNQIAAVDFATIHIYPDQWLPNNPNDEVQARFASKWIDEHVKDSVSILKKPLLVDEFRKSSKSGNYNVGVRDTYFTNIFVKLYLCAKRGGPCAGALFWQLFDEGMENMGDGYEVVLQQNPLLLLLSIDNHVAFLHLILS